MTIEAVTSPKMERINPEPLITPDEMRRNADLSMKVAKSGGRDLRDDLTAEVGTLVAVMWRLSAEICERLDAIKEGIEDVQRINSRIWTPKNVPAADGEKPAE